jgi:hypothetical protein
MKPISQCEANVIEFILHDSWLERFHPNAQRWKAAKQHNYFISQMTDNALNKETFLID